MRWSRYYLFTSREVPKDAEVISHQLMARTGMIRKVAAGASLAVVPVGSDFGLRCLGIVCHHKKRSACHTRQPMCQKTQAPPTT